ncbi:MAG: tryptophan 7-halogenase [Planctomycetes bacterium]|nr:tryptophan 7-halogenase [Planctomycetota bacterium]
MIQTAPITDPQPQPELADVYDVVVIGAGPGGSTVAALVAEFGHRVLILERSRFPRFHVGESLIPETYGTLKRRGVLDKLRQTAFPKKFSVQFVTETGKETAPFYFDEHKCHESSQTWQVIRGEFDRMLLDNAVDRGATAHTHALVRDVLFDGDQAHGVCVQIESAAGEKSTRDIAAKVIVDATGQSTFLATRLGLKTTDPRLKKGSIWTYYQGAQRDGGRDEGATIILQTEGKKSWFWYIPLSDDTVSIGCTGGMDYLFGNNRGSAERIFAAELDRCAGIRRRIQSAARCTDFFTTKDFSYNSKRLAGPGWVLVGDACGFIDPVYSSGVFLALKTGEFAADAIHAALRNDDLSGERLGSWEQEYRNGLELFRKLVYAFYEPGFSFGQFLKEYPQYRSHLVDILIGDVFKPGLAEMFEAIDALAKRPIDRSLETG